jgi:ATP-binding cassette subfamily B protein/subfamily B ATP-binding cassette protein MsbA
MTAGMVALMARVDPGLALVAAAVAPLMAGTSFLAGRRLRAAARARREIESRVQSLVQRALAGVPVVQAFTQEGGEQRRFEELAGAALRAQRRGALAGGLYKLLSGLAATLGAAAVLWVGARHTLEGRLSLGSLLVFLAYLSSLQGQLRAFAGVYGTLQETGASVERVGEALAEEAEVRDRPGAAPLPPAAGHVRLEGVTFGYERERPVLRGVSLEASAGQTVAIVGPTGAGKTTLVGRALLRPLGGARPGGRPGRPRRAVAEPARPDRPGAAGAVPVPLQHRREHRLRQTGGLAAGGRGRRPGRQPPRVHRPAAAGL